MTRKQRTVILKVWGYGLVALGLLVAAAGVAGLVSANGLRADADAACAGSADRLCGSLETYVAALLLVLGPLAVLGGALLALVGGGLAWLGRWVDRSLSQAARELAADAARPPNG